MSVLDSIYVDGIKAKMLSKLSNEVNQDSNLHKAKNEPEDVTYRQALLAATERGKFISDDGYYLPRTAVVHARGQYNQYLKRREIIDRALYKAKLILTSEREQGPISDVGFYRPRSELLRIQREARRAERDDSDKAFEEAYEGYEQYYEGRRAMLEELKLGKIPPKAVLNNYQAYHRTRGAHYWKKVSAPEETFTQRIIKRWFTPKLGEPRWKTALKGIGAGVTQATIGWLELPWQLSWQWREAIEGLKNWNRKPTEEDVHNVKELFSKVTTTTMTNEQFVMAEERAKRSSQEFTYLLGQLAGTALVYGGLYGIQKTMTLRAQKAFRKQFFDEQSIIWRPDENVFKKFPEVMSAPHGEKALVKTGVVYKNIGGGVFKFPVRKSVFVVKETPVPNFYDNFVFGRTLSGKTVVRVKGTPTSLWKVADNIKPFKKDVFRMKGGGASTPWWKTGNAPYPGFIKDEILSNLADFAKFENVAVSKAPTVKKFVQMPSIKKTFTMRKAEAIKSFYAQMPKEGNYYQFGVLEVGKFTTEYDYSSEVPEFNPNFSFTGIRSNQKGGQKDNFNFEAKVGFVSTTKFDTSFKPELKFTQIEVTETTTSEGQIEKVEPRREFKPQENFKQLRIDIPVEKERFKQEEIEEEKNKFVFRFSARAIRFSPKFAEPTKKPVTFEIPKFEEPKRRKKIKPRKKKKAKEKKTDFVLLGELDLFAQEVFDAAGITTVKIDVKKFRTHFKGPLFDEPAWLAKPIEPMRKKKKKDKRIKPKKTSGFELPKFKLAF